MKKPPAHKFSHSLTLLSFRELFQIQKTITDTFRAEVHAEVIYPQWEIGSVVMYFNFEEQEMCSGIIRRMDPSVITVQHCASDRFETVPAEFVEKVPRGKIAIQDFRSRASSPSTYFSVGQMCATVIGQHDLEIGSLESKDSTHAVLLCNHQYFTVAYGDFWRAPGVQP